MKRPIIATLVGAIIVFAYQALSWMILPTHENAFKYSAKEGPIMEAIAAGITEEGVYTIPGTPPGTTHEQAEAQWAANEGKPWVMLTYHPTWSMAMGGPMVKGFLFDLLSVAILVWILTTAAVVFATFGSRFIVCLLFGLFTLFNSTVEAMNWWHLPWHYASGEMVDHVVTWALCGLWLGWYLKPKAA